MTPSPTPPDDKRCTANSRKTGERCKQRAVQGFSVCYYHGANGHKGRPPNLLATGPRSLYSRYKIALDEVEQGCLTPDLQHELAAARALLDQMQQQFSIAEAVTKGDILEAQLKIIEAIRRIIDTMGRGNPQITALIVKTEDSGILGMVGEALIDVCGDETAVAVLERIQELITRRDYEAESPGRRYEQSLRDRPRGPGRPRKPPSEPKPKQPRAPYGSRTGRRTKADAAAEADPEAGVGTGTPADEGVAA